MILKMVTTNPANKKLFAKIMAATSRGASLGEIVNGI